MRRLEELPGHIKWFALAIRDYVGEWPTVRDVAFEVRWEFDVPPWDATDVVRDALRDETVNMRTGIRYGQERVIVNAVPLCSVRLMLHRRISPRRTPRPGPKSSCAPGRGCA